MAQQTDLSVEALPGPTHSFSAKEESVLKGWNIEAVETHTPGAVAAEVHAAGAVAGEVDV